ncbi:MAG: hypothetical protein M3680_12630 [Myxococcota bacterium]|nr:hypothetical protein [Myxococcota bacterium]
MDRSLSVLFVLLAAGCGTDGTAGPNGDTTRPDGGATGDARPASGDGGVPGDAAALTVCQEATLHSDFAWLQANVFTPSCATSMCHSGPDPEVGLNLDAGPAYNNLVNKGASTVTGWTRVVPGSLATSYLAVSLGRAEGPPPRDGFMPLQAEALCEEKLAAIERWIIAGAQP